MTIKKKKHFETKMASAVEHLLKKSVFFFYYQRKLQIKNVTLYLCVYRNCSIVLCDYHSISLKIAVARSYTYISLNCFNTVLN